MEIKKSAKADLERGKGLSLLLGLLVALSVVFVGLEWRSAVAQAQTTDRGFDAQEIEDVMNIEDQQKPEEPEPEPQQAQQVEIQLPDEIKVVSNDKEVIKPTIISVDQDKPLPPPNIPLGTKNVQADEDVDQAVFEIVEENPEFPGGPEALLKYLSKNIVYPESAIDNGIQGRVTVRFVVERDGSVSGVEIQKGVDQALDKEAMRVVKGMPKWKPGRQQGRTVRTRFSVPVVFRLQ
jgi:tonB family C-terminal domain